MPQFKLFFRGDDRQSDEIFQKGFEARDMTTPLPVQYESNGIYSDVNSSTGVCVSADLEAAPIFPQNTAPDSFVYMLGIDMFGAETLHSHTNQITSYASQVWSVNNQPALYQGPEPLPLYWYAREFAAKRVPPQQVAGVIRIERHFEGKTPKQFKILSYQFNDLCPLKTKHKTLLTNYLVQMQGKGLIAISQIQDGFYSKSLNRKLTEEELNERF